MFWTESTVYTRGYGDVPEEVEPGDTVTLEYDGWTGESRTHVRLVEDDPPGGTFGGNDETIRRESVSGPGFFEGPFTFTPSDYVGEGEERDRVIEVQARADGVADQL